MLTRLILTMQLQSHIILKQTFELGMLYHKNHRYIENRKNNFFAKKNWFGEVHPNVQCDPQLDYVISRVH